MSKYSAAVIGLGQIGLLYDLDPKRTPPSSHVLAYYLHSNIELVAGIDVCEDREDVLKKFAPEALFYKNIEEMLAAHKLDIISICTPPEQHLSIIKLILEFSTPKIIFCEKPVVSSIKEAKDLESLLYPFNTLLIPNLSRRWHSGIMEIKQHIEQSIYGDLNRIHINYTRGIYNTGAHLFDLVSYFSGSIEQVQVIQQISTSSDEHLDPSYSFSFVTDKGVYGYAEAFDDRDYYLFEVDLFFERGKIEIRMSGDDILYYRICDHPLFSGFTSLKLSHSKSGLLGESTIANAVDHIVKVLEGKSAPICSLQDGLHPLYVSEALLRSFNSLEKVGVMK